MHGQPLLMDGLSSAMRSARPDVLFEWSERARQFNHRIVPVRPPPDPEVAAELAELRVLRGDSVGDWLATPRAAELHDHLRRRQWSETSAAGVESHVSMDELRAALDDDTALLSFVWSEGRMVCLVVAAEVARVIDIPAWRSARTLLGGLRSDLDMAASVRSGPLALVVRESLEERLRALSNALLAAPIAAARDRSLPHHRARRAERDPLGDAARAARQTLHDRRLGYALGRSEGACALLPAIGRVRGRPSRRARAGGSRRRDRAHGTVPSSSKASARPRSGRRASPLAWTCLHIAAHGRHAADNPLFSGLELADGALFGYDIDLIPRPRPAQSSSRHAKSAARRCAGARRRSA